MNVSFAVRENGSISATDASTGNILAGIEVNADASAFAVHGEDESILAETFETMEDARAYILSSVQGTEIIPTPERAPRKRSDRKSNTMVRAPRADAPVSENNTPARGAKRDKGTDAAKDVPVAPKRVQKVSTVMQRNLQEVAAGNLEVYVDSSEVREKLLASRAYKKLVLAGEFGKNGTGNIYPTPAQARGIAKLVPDTNVAAQCIAGGWRNWKGIPSLAKRIAAMQSASA
jgi:hypothetical protein